MQKFNDVRGNKKGRVERSLCVSTLRSLLTPQRFMKTKSYRLNIAPRQAKGFSAYAEVRKVVPPIVKVDNAAEGKFTISTTKNTTLGKYQLELKEKGHLPISINIEVIPEEKD